MYGLNSAYRNAMPSIYGETWSSSLIPYTLAPFLGSQGTTKLSYLSSRLFRYIRKSYAFLALHRTMGACTTSSILSCQPPISSISALFHISDNDLGAAHSNRRSLQPRIRRKDTQCNRRHHVPGNGHLFHPQISALIFEQPPLLPAKHLQNFRAIPRYLQLPVRLVLFVCVCIHPKFLDQFIHSLFLHIFPAILKKDIRESNPE